MNQEKVTSESYTLKTENGNWLGQVVLTSDIVIKYLEEAKTKLLTLNKK